jgi:hypothetical protein
MMKGASGFSGGGVSGEGSFPRLEVNEVNTL